MKQSKLDIARAALDDIRHRAADVDARRGDAIRAMGQAQATLKREPDNVDALQALDVARRRLEGLDAQRLQPRAFQNDQNPETTLDHEWKQAQAKLDELRRQRWALAQRVAELEAQAKRFAGHFDKLAAAIREVASFADVMPSGTGWTDRQAAARVAWVNETRAMVGALPAMRARLEDFGDDPDYNPQTTPRPGQTDELWNEAQAALQGKQPSPTATWAEIGAARERQHDLDVEAHRVELLGQEVDRMNQYYNRPSYGIWHRGQRVR